VIWVKKIIVSLLIGFFCLASSLGLGVSTALAKPLPPPHHHFHHAKHHHSFWVKYGKWIAVAGVLWWLIDESKHHKSDPPAPAPQPEMLPGDRALHNVYGDNIPQVK
jgi:hypothetical protein